MVAFRERAINSYLARVLDHSLGLILLHLRHQILS